MDTADELVQTIQSLWPEATAAPGRARRPDPTAVAEFAVVPHLRAPRLLVPARGTRAAAAALWRFNAAAAARETWGRAAMAATIRATGLSAFPDRIRLHGRSDGSLAEHLGRLFDQAVSFSVGIGTARVNRKPVLQVFGEDGRSLAFAKLGNSYQARADVRAEVASLSEVGQRSWRTLSTPRLLDAGTWRGMDVLVMSALPTTPWQSPRGQWRLPRSAMTELAEGFADGARPLAELPWLQRQRTIADGLPDVRLGTEYAEAIDAALARDDGAPWAIGAWHGDWTPWNMARRGRRVQLWDWERFERGVPAGLDAFHYYVNTVTRQDGTSAETIIRGLERAGASRHERDTRSHRLAGLYLVAAAGRYLPLTTAAAGHHIADRARCTLDALRLWTVGGAGTTGS